jgi:glutamate-1-semialdehyde 2,1-aminomutase
MSFDIGRQGRLNESESHEISAATRLLPGGVLGGNALPTENKFVFSRGSGSRFWDVSGNCYIDYVLGSGALVLGHAVPEIQRAVAEQAGRGTHMFAFLNEPAVRYAERIAPYIRCAERLRFTVSGGESTFHAMRLARAFSGKDKILKFEGAYHGSHDYAQMSTSPKQLVDFPTGVPDTAGIPKAVQQLTLVAPFNDLDALQRILAEHHKDLAAVIIEPIQRIIHPKPGFLAGVRELTARYGVLLILDEVVTGFRYGLGGAQEYFDIKPDLATYGKIIGGGLPVGAVAGRADILEQADPSKKGQPAYVYQNGTLQGHPLGCAAGMASLSLLEAPGFYDRLFATAEKLREAIRVVFSGHRMPVTVFGEGPMWHFVFGDKVPTNYRELVASDTKRLVAFDNELMRNGIFVLPNNRRFVSIKHTDDDIEMTAEAFDRACRKLNT